MDMKHETQLTEDDKRLMERYGISCESRRVFFLEGYKYDKLQDAARYAEINSKKGLNQVPTT